MPCVRRDAPPCPVWGENHGIGPKLWEEFAKTVGLLGVKKNQPAHKAKHGGGFRTA